MIGYRSDLIVRLEEVMLSYVVVLFLTSSPYLPKNYVMKSIMRVVNSMKEKALHTRIF